MLKETLKTIRAKFRDVAFTYRMGAGFAGDVNRTHPCEVEAALIAAANGPAAYGNAVILDSTSQPGVRGFVAGDTAVTQSYGVTVRPFPIQAPAGSSNASQGLGAATPPSSGAIDVMRSGLIMVKVVGAPVKGGAVFVWCAASGGGHTQGGFEAAASGGNTAALDTTKYSFNGAPDSNGIVELSFNV